jgi:hypothetical protein
MNGLTAANVERIVIGLKIGIHEAILANSSIAAKELTDVLSLIEAMQRNNTTQPSRPDRVGDECWYATWDVDNGRWDWRRGIFRGICDRSYPFVAEDAITKSLELCLHVNFSAEAPK